MAVVAAAPVALPGVRGVGLRGLDARGAGEEGGVLLGVRDVVAGVAGVPLEPRLAFATDAGGIGARECPGFGFVDARQRGGTPLLPDDVLRVSQVLLSTGA